MRRRPIRDIRELERLIGLNPSVPPNTPRSDILRERKKRLGRPWRGKRA